MSIYIASLRASSQHAHHIKPKLTPARAPNTNSWSAPTRVGCLCSHGSGGGARHTAGDTIGSVAAEVPSVARHSRRVSRQFHDVWRRYLRATGRHRCADRLTVSAVRRTGVHAALVSPPLPDREIRINILWLTCFIALSRVLRL